MQKAKHHYGFYIASALVILTSLIWVILQRAASVPRPDELNLDPPSGFDVAMDDTDTNIWTFVHVTDLHLEVAVPKRSEDWWTLVNQDLALIDPVKIFVSGDMTHAAPDYQVEAEWAIYRDALVDAGLFNRSDVVFDVKGNHDHFSIHSWEDPDNFFRTHSVSGAAGLYDAPPHAVVSTEYTHNVTGTVSWTVFDLAAYPGLDTRYNLMVNGWTDDVVAQIEEQLLAPAEAHSDLQHTFTVGHYPTQQFGTGPRAGINALADRTGFTAYLCGHTHQDDWWVYRPGWAELENRDFKWGRKYKVYAMDNSVVAHVDAPVDTWPLALVSNPKNAQFLLQREPLGAIAESTHIRVLGWSPAGVVNGSVSLDGAPFCDLAQTGAKGDLWTCPWDPSDYGEGLHEIEVTLVDAEGRESVSRQPFSVDGTHGGVPYTFMDLAAESDWGLYTWLLTFFTWGYVVLWKVFGPAVLLRWLQDTQQVGTWGRGVRSRLRTDVLTHINRPDMNRLPVLEPAWVTRYVPVKQFWSVMKLPPAVWWWFAVSGLWILVGPQKVGWLTTEGSEGMKGIVWAWGVTVWGEEAGGTYFRWEIWPFNIFLVAWSTYPALVLASWTAYEPIIKDWIASRSKQEQEQWFQYARAGLPSLYGLPAAGLVGLQLFFASSLLSTVGFYGLASTLQSLVPNWVIAGNLVVLVWTYWYSLSGRSTARRPATKSQPAEPAVAVQMEQTASATKPAGAAAEASVEAAGAVVVEATPVANEEA